MSNIINELKRINIDKIKQFEAEDNRSDEYKTHLIIMKILNSSENCFLELPIETSFDILKCLVNEDKVEDVYMQTISYNEFKKIN